MRQDEVTQVMNDPLAQELLGSNIPVRLAYTGTDGFPRVVLLGFHWNGEEMIVCTVPNAPKVRALYEQIDHPALAGASRNNRKALVSSARVSSVLG